ncbi:MAG TPA: hypothetical protein PLJ00_14990 [Chitinophagales bacterium]|nr:hypothetical protein [Chitinophagales bacterium]
MISKDGTHAIGINTILHTKNGTKIGNAIVTGIAAERGVTMYSVTTDYGNRVAFRIYEIEELFEIAWSAGVEEYGYSCDEIQKMQSESHKNAVVTDIMRVDGTLHALNAFKKELANIRKLLNCDDNESTYDEVARFVSIVKSMRKHQIDFFANGNSVDKQTRGEMISASKKYERLVDGMMAEKPNEVLKIQQNDLFENNGGC